MGLIKGLYDKTISNAAGSNFTQCSTWRDIEASHLTNSPILGAEEIRGMLLMLSIGLSMALSAFLGELLTHKLLRGCRGKKKVVKMTWIS